MNDIPPVVTQNHYNPDLTCGMTCMSVLTDVVAKHIFCCCKYKKKHSSHQYEISKVLLRF